MTEKASHRFAIYDNLYNALGLLLVYPLSWSKLTQLSKDVWVENANWVENPTSRCLAGIWCQTKKNSRQGNSHMSMSILFTLHAVFYFSSFRSFTKGLPLISPCAESYSILRSDGCDRLQPIWYPSLFGAPAYLVPQPIHLWHSASASQHNGQITIAIKLLLTTLPFHIGIHFTLPQVPVKYSEFRSCLFSRTDCRRSLDEAFPQNRLHIVAVACLPQSPIKGISCQSHKLIFQDKKLFGQTGFKSQIVFWRYKKSQLFSHSLTEANNQLGRVCVWGHQREILSQDYFASGPNRRCGQWDHLNWENYIWKC